MKTMGIWLLAGIPAFLVGCANPGVVQVGGDLYLLSKQDHGGIFGSLPKLKADVINEANAFAASKGMTAIPVSFKEKPVGMKFADLASVEYQFRLVPPNSPQARGGSLNADRQTLPVRPDVSVQSTRTTSAVVEVRGGTASSQSGTQKDLYTELLKLEDLRKRGLLTQAEFAEQKRKLLEAK